jgi:hypothetical protein
VPGTNIATTSGAVNEMHVANLIPNMALREIRGALVSVATM